MIFLSLQRLLSAADFGPLRLGMHQDDVLHQLGQPDHRAVPRRGREAVWKYGDIELLFDDTTPHLPLWSLGIHDFADRPTGGQRLTLNPWIMRSGLPISDFTAHASRIGMLTQRESPRHATNHTHVVTLSQPRVYVDFVTEPTAAEPIVGLSGIWMTTRHP